MGVRGGQHPPTSPALWELADVVSCLTGQVWTGELSWAGAGAEPTWTLAPQARALPSLRPPAAVPAGGSPGQTLAGGTEGQLDPRVICSVLAPFGLCFSGIGWLQPRIFSLAFLPLSGTLGEGWAGRPGHWCVEGTRSLRGVGGVCGPVPALDPLPTVHSHSEGPLQAAVGGARTSFPVPACLSLGLGAPTFQKGLLYRPEVILWALMAGDLGLTLGVGSWGQPSLSRGPSLCT